jgi:hypothetical protein
MLVIESSEARDRKLAKILAGTETLENENFAMSKIKVKRGEPQRVHCYPTITPNTQQRARDLPSINLNQEKSALFCLH